MSAPKLGTMNGRPEASTIRIDPPEATKRIQPGQILEFACDGAKRAGHVAVVAVDTETGSLSFPCPLHVFVPAVAYGDDILEYEIPCTRCRCKACVARGAGAVVAQCERCLSLDDYGEWTFLNGAQLCKRCFVKICRETLGLQSIPVAGTP